MNHKTWLTEDLNVILTSKGLSYVFHCNLWFVICKNISQESRSAKYFRLTYISMNTIDHNERIETFPRFSIKVFMPFCYFTLESVALCNIRYIFNIHQLSSGKVMFTLLFICPQEGKGRVSISLCL